MRFPDEPTVSIVIPVHQGGDKFCQCLASIAATAPAPHEVIVVADGDDDAWQTAQAAGLQALRVPTAEGPAKARNRGARIATGDLLFFVDADVEIYPDTVGRVIDAFRQAPTTDALIGSYDDQPGEPNFLSQYRNLLHHYTHQTSSPEASTFWGACGAIRRDVFLGIGGFDEQWPKQCIEDIELGARLRQAGYRIQLVKTLQVKHLKRWEVGSMLKADFFYRALPWTRLILRDRQLNNDLNLKQSNRISVVLVYLLLGMLPLMVLWPTALIVATILASILFGLNLPVYRFFGAKRGPIFAARTVFWHWLYYFYSGLAFGIGLAQYFVSRVASPLKRLGLATQ